MTRLMVYGPMESPSLGSMAISGIGREHRHPWPVPSTAVRGGSDLQASGPAATLFVGTAMDTATIGDYQVHRTIGRGRYGVVYSASHVPTRRVVALKVLADQFAQDTVYRARFRRECDLLAQLSHPHVVPILEAGEDGDALFLAMRLIQ